MERAKLFKNGQSQAVRLPKKFRFEGTEVFIKREGNAVVLLPVQVDWKAWLESLDFPTDFMDEREQPIANDERDEAFE